MMTTLKTGLFSNVHTVLTVLIAAKRLTSGQLGVAWAVHDGSGGARTSAGGSTRKVRAKGRARVRARGGTEATATVALVK